MRRNLVAAAILAAAAPLARGETPNPAPSVAAAETCGTLAGIRAEVRCDGERTSFAVAFPDPDAALRASGVGFLVGYILEVEAIPPDGGPTTFASPLLAPAVGVPSPGMVAVGYVEPRVWPAGTRFSIAVHDRDGNLLSPLTASH